MSASVRCYMIPWTVQMLKKGSPVSNNTRRVTVLQQTLATDQRRKVIKTRHAKCSHAALPVHAEICLFLPAQHLFEHGFHALSDCMA